MCRIATILAAACFVSTSTAGAAIRWEPSFEDALAKAKETDRPIIAFWKGAPDSKRKFEPKWTLESELQQAKISLLPASELQPYAGQFIWVQFDINEDPGAEKKLGILENFKRFDDLKKPPSRMGFVFTRADGKIYGRFGGRPVPKAFADMMVGVLKAHSPPDSKIRKMPYPTAMTYRPYKVPYGGRPKQHVFPPHTESWRQCDKCKGALKKAMAYLEGHPNRQGWLGNFFAGFAFMMAPGHEKELARSIDIAREDLKPRWGGYSSWRISQAMLLMTEYSLRHGLTPENKKALIEAHQYAAENVDSGGGWFHHPKHGGVNYAWDISPIGSMFYPAFLQMQKLGLEAEPGLTLGRGYLERLSDGYSIGYGTPFRHGRWGSVGKNGLVMMGYYNTGLKNETFPRLLGDFLADNPEAPPKGHGSSWHHFFGAGIGSHLMGAEHYAKYAGYWLHPMIDCQKVDGSIAPFPHDHAGARGGDPPDAVLESVKNADRGDYGATAILASLILMTEPDTFGPPKPKESKARREPARPEKAKVVAKPLQPKADPKAILEEQARQLEQRADALLEQKQFGQALRLYELHLKRFQSASRHDEVRAKRDAMAADPAITARIKQEAGRRECESWLSMARAYKKVGRSDLAKSYLKKLIGKYPDTEWAKEANKLLHALP